MPVKTIEILLIKLGERMVGIDSSDIIKVIPHLNNDKDREIVNLYREKGKLFSISDIMNYKNNINNPTYISLEAENGIDLLIEVPEISHIIKIEISKILVVPEFIRKWQKPFFLWGFINNEKKLVSLITFSFFITGDKYGR
jgi:hypothetical protein